MNRSRMESRMLWLRHIRVMGIGLIGLLIFATVMVPNVAARESNRLSQRNALAPLATFNATFDTDPGLPLDSFSQTLDGVQFDFTFTADGDGGGGQGLSFDSAYGEENSSSINLLSGAVNTSTTERITITRNDGQDFVFSSIFVNNTNAATATVAGYDNGGLVGTAQTVATGSSGTLTFGGIVVDEVRITSTDFYTINIDSFAGDTATPTAVTLRHAQAGSDQGMAPFWLALIGLVATMGVVVARRWGWVVGWVG